MSPNITRRQFVESAALAAAATAVSTSVLEPAALGQGAPPASAGIGGPLPTAKEVAMGSVFPYGAVYFRKSNPPAED